MGVGEVAVSEPAQSGAAWEYASDVQVGFVGVDGVGRLGSLARYWGEPFERAAPVRKFIAFEGQKNFTGDYWAATSRDLVGYESWVERDAAMALDFDPSVIALASQPFSLAWWDGERDRQHTRDYFARLADGTGVVVDVRPESLIDEEAAGVFSFTEGVCTTVGGSSGWSGTWGSRSKRICAGWRATGIFAATRRRWQRCCGRCSSNRNGSLPGRTVSVTGRRCCRRSITFSGSTS
jgi:hypothetical protein